METIKPIKVVGDPVDDPAQDPAEANPVKILHREGFKDSCTVLIECNEQEPHKLTIRGNRVTIHNHTYHTSDQIQQDYILKELESSNAASPCTRVKIWGEQGGFEIDP